MGGWRAMYMTEKDQRIISESSFRPLRFAAQMRPSLMAAQALFSKEGIGKRCVQEGGPTNRSKLNESCDLKGP